MPASHSYPSLARWIRFYAVVNASSWSRSALPMDVFFFRSGGVVLDLSVTFLRFLLKMRAGPSSDSEPSSESGAGSVSASSASPQPWLSKP